MKKNLLIILTAISSLLYCTAGMMTHAEEQLVYPDKSIRIETDSFVYTNQNLCSSKLEDVPTDTTYMVTGVYYLESNMPTPAYYTVSRLYSGGDILIKFEEVERCLTEDSEPLAYGDVFYCDAKMVAEIYPGELEFYEEIRNLGKGTDIFGKEFVRVMNCRFTMDVKKYGDENNYIADLSGIDVLTGDVDDTEEIDILDVITLNRSVLGKVGLTPYGELSADVNGDGKVDAVDGLAIMRYIVGLTDTLDA